MFLFSILILNGKSQYCYFFLSVGDNTNEKDDFLAVDFTHHRTSSNASSASSAAIPVPSRSLSRQSSLNCATSSNKENKGGQCSIDWDALEVDGTETLGEEPCFSPLKAASQPCRVGTVDDICRCKESEGNQGSSNSEGILKSPLSISQYKQLRQSRKSPHRASSASGFRSVASSGYISGGTSLSWRKPKRLHMGFTTAENKSCPSLVETDYSPKVGLRSQDPSKIQAAGGDNILPLKSSEGLPETCAPCSDPGHHSSTGFEHMWSKGEGGNRGKSLEQSSSVETCDASTSPHLPLQWLCPWTSKSMEELQVCSN